MTRTLIVEDNTTFRQSFKEILRSEFPSLDILEAADGEEAIQMVNSLDIDLIFMDIRLPGENGLSLTKTIKSRHPEIVVAILTSYDLPEYREAAQQSKADHFITKGSPTAMILDVVKSVLKAPKAKREG
jgi:DNA-binding NarL/FixJ family response regulator